MAEFPKSRSVLLRWGLVGVVVSTSVVVLISALAGVAFSEIGRIGAIPFAAASGVALARLAAQAVRFRILAQAMSGRSRLDFASSSEVRIGSEFVALTTPALIGGELVRAAWLSSRKVEVGRALWIGYFEVLLDVYIGSTLSLIAAVYAIFRGAHLIAAAILAIVLPLSFGYTALLLLPALKSSKAPSWPFRIAGRIVGHQRAERLKSSVDNAVLSFGSATREVLRRSALPLLAKLFAWTLILAFLSGLSLWIVFNSAAQGIDILGSVLVAYGSFALAALPVTVGGSGLTELGVQWYTSTVLGFSSWAAVVVWRIASYHVVLAASGIAFLRLLTRIIGSDVRSEYDWRRSDETIIRTIRGGQVGNNGS